ncbi:MAG: hypothetical protein HYX71_06665 [Opitutae bacterium]|nr:hypothetical protein [Opitutae bacterium]
MTPPDNTPRPIPLQTGRWPAVLLSLAVLVLTWFSLGAISRRDPWYRNLDMNSQNTADALALNSGLSPNLIDQPGVPMKYLLALDFRARHFLGQLPVWNLKKFGDSADPLREIPALIRAGRTHSRILVMGFILAAAALAYSVSRRPAAACLTVILLGGSSGLLFHGLLTRPELLCVGFGNVLALLCTWRGTLPGPWLRNHLWLLLAGFFGGLAALAKLPGVCYLVLGYGWCWLAALTAGKNAPVPASPRAEEDGFWRGLLPAAAAVGVLGLLFRLSALQDDELGAVAVGRLRFAAVAIGALPVLALWPGRHPVWRFLLARSRELALLGAGALASFPVGYLLLRSIQPEPAALDYIARTLHLLADPAAMVRIHAANPEVGKVFLIFVRQDAFLFLATPVLVATLLFVPRVPSRLKAFLVLLLAGGVGLTLLLSKRHFLAQYSLFAQAPFLLIWALGLHQLAEWTEQTWGPWRRRLALVAVIGVVASFLLTAHRRTHLKYTNYQDDAMLPLNNFSVTFLFDHDAHTPTYLRIMREHYGNREQFVRALEAYLANPDNRH